MQNELAAGIALSYSSKMVTQLWAFLPKRECHSADFHTSAGWLQEISHNKHFNFDNLSKNTNLKYCCEWAISETYEENLFK
jgi:hypothetical protein